MKSVLMLMCDNCTMNAYASLLEQQPLQIVKVNDSAGGISALRCALFNVIVLELNGSLFADQMVFLKEAANYISMDKVVVIIEKVKDGPMAGVEDYLKDIGVKDIYVKPMGLIAFEKVMKRFEGVVAV